MGIAPASAVWFTSEAHFARPKSRGYAEPQVPGHNEACYLYVPAKNVVAVPYSQRSLETKAELKAALLNDRRPLQLFHYAGAHGMAAALRQRLYDLCDLHLHQHQQQLDLQLLHPSSSAGSDASTTSAASSVATSAVGPPNQRWSCPTPQAPLPQEDSLRILAHTQFCPVPAGDSPGRAVMWDALRRGCVPVLFSSCPQASVLQSHAGQFLPEDPGMGFGVRKFSVLLNQTAVMTNDNYLAATLSSITPAQMRAMRLAVRPYLQAATFAELDWRMGELDAGEFVIRHVVGKFKGAPTPKEWKFDPEEWGAWNASLGLPGDFAAYFPDIDYAKKGK